MRRFKAWKPSYQPPAIKTKFPWAMWQWTGSDENLFELDREQRTWFKLFCQAAA